MSINDKIKQAEKLTFGTARLVSGHARLSRGKKEGVTASQLRSIFDDLEGMSDAEINGFIDIGDKLVNGDINIPKTAFSMPDDTSKENNKD
ncbi:MULTISPECIES: hypothetical protein [unclassified Psychrobacter]|uniref:hypothetical protein n=1 Tax=unclassified Psychrobacter TaxID=196806 RepID=UPI0025EA2923|nr:MULTISPECIES: hypothetical protein [unclassified Psychrobacter]